MTHRQPHKSTSFSWPNQVPPCRLRFETAAAILAATVIIGLGGCAVEKTTSEVGGAKRDANPQIFFMDLVPETGMGLYLVPKRSKAEMSGGVFRWNGEGAAIVTRDLVFPHNIEPFEEGYVFTDTDQDAIHVVDPTGRSSRSFREMTWLDGERDSLRGTNWVLPLDTTAVESFLDVGPLGHPAVLICKIRTVEGETWMWWSICEIENGVLRSLWEMKAPGRKAHTGLLHDGVFYGASSASNTLVVKGADLDFELVVGDVRYMEVFNNKLWMAGDGFVGVLDDLPPATDAEPTNFVEGIGRAQAVHVTGDRIFVTANGWLLIFDHNGRQLESLGSQPPESGESWIHDRLRALGYLE